jgi:D-alanyl-D-alanine carboxypeptidase
MKYFLRITLLLFLFQNVQAQTGKTERIKFLLDSIQIAGNFPGMSFALVDKDRKIIAVTAGYNDKEKSTPLKTTDLLMQGSVGKTYVSAIAMQLIQQKKLNLDEKVSTYLGHHPWFNRIPNASDITVRMIMNHSSGVMRYEFKEQFTKDLTANPDRYWKPADLLVYIFDEKASFPAGEGWEYSDTNYILLGMIIEQLTGAKYYDLLQKNLLSPLGLKHTFASDKRKLPGLSQGYAGAKNEFGGKDKVIDEKGNFIINPQFEWTGGGVYSTTTDLALWGKDLYEGKVFDSTLLPVFLNGVPAKLGRDTRYGLGVILRNTAIGAAHGHSGFFPGYMTEMLYFPAYRICAAVQVNSSDFANLKANLVRCLVLLTTAALDR